MRLKLKWAGWVCALGLSAFACSSDDGDNKGGNGGSGASGGSGGQVGECVPTAAECYVDGPRGPGAECLAKHDNSSANVWSGRFSYLKIEKPAALANQLVQNLVVDKGITLNQRACNEEGDGTFTWLLEFDPASGRLKTGGGQPITDPKAGSCFVTIPNSNPAIAVAPTEVDVDVTESGEFEATIDAVVVPIFLDVEMSKTILLPLHQIAFSGSFSDDRNCIGRYNGDQFEISNTCKPDTTQGQTVWTTGGSLQGYITIEEAEAVYIDDLKASLCAQIAGSTWKGQPTGRCAETDAWQAGERPEGDWCAATNSPATGACNDAWQLKAGFAASAMKVNGDCP
ncbi:MAG: hypothetical protein KIT72_00455 [Polyangiaceae bacterium]|nr:hypothetical protein [Polyangiaceae bacterium]MCW5788867.1 hypothetical protein [Polyangiaceae bacterium]